MGTIQHDEAGRWSAADLDILAEFRGAEGTFDPAVSLPVLAAGIFAPRGPVAFRRCLVVLAEALGRAIVADADADTVAKIVARFTAETEAAARLLWLDSVGPGAAVSAVH